tara:strand:+ start:3871 stop:4041 length:171 start_codon:yes stop_codon:yes gene_type:complete
MKNFSLKKGYSLLEVVKAIDFFNMADLIELCLLKKYPFIISLIHEYWGDIGTPNNS